MYKRYVIEKYIESLKDTPVVLLNGARQTGKSTLVKWIAEHYHQAPYYSLDNAATLAAVHSDPTSFIHGLNGPVIIDEIQRAPDLLLAIKEDVDKHRQPGQFLLTGSANILFLPKVSDSLAGRMEIIDLWPLSRGEILGRKENFLGSIFSKTSPSSFTSDIHRNEIIDIILQGGFPEVLARASWPRRDAWINSYMTAILQRDVRDIANIEGLSQLARLVSLLAARTGSLLNLAEISRSSHIPHTTLIRYMIILQTLFLIQLIPAWSNNLSKRVVKAPKLYFCDTALSTHLLGLNTERFLADPGLLGPWLENFVIMELKKQMGWSAFRLQLFHYRTPSGQEVDIILENPAGQCVGIEVKASSAVTQQDFKGLSYLSEQLGDRFLRGILLYTGEQSISFGKKLFAIPLNAIWTI